MVAAKKDELKRLKKLRADGSREELEAAKRELKAMDQQPNNSTKNKEKNLIADSREVILTEAMNEQGIGDRIEKAQNT